MKKENKLRLVFWGMIWLCVLASSIVGYYAFSTGHGQRGKIVYSLKPIINNFNSLEQLKKYNDAGIKFNAYIDGGALIFNYVSASDNKEYKYLYEDGNKKILESDYQENDTVAQIINKLLIEAIVVKNDGYEGVIFNKYNLEDFSNSIDEGILYKKSGNNISVMIDIEKNPLNYKNDESKSLELSDFNTEINKLFNIAKEYYNQNDINKEVTYSNNTNCKIINHEGININYVISFNNLGKINKVYFSNNNYQYYEQAEEINIITEEKINTFDENTKNNYFKECEIKEN